MYKFLLKFLLTIAPILLLSSCVVHVKDHGYEQNADNFAKLKVNQSTKEDVLDLLGSPSTTDSFNEDSWYYVSVKTKKVSLLNADVTGHVVNKLQFKQGVLSNISMVDSKKKRALNFNKAESPVKGDDSGSFKDFFYNIGRYNKNTRNH
jgi:outer membrane protein assembly factor BamE (lipoprotein component of BamABCDE complex)